MPKFQPTPGDTKPLSAPKPLLVVGVGASAGGLQACRSLVESLGNGHGMSFILIQHLDPTHESMLVDLLADSTSMTVVQAADGMRVESGHLYVIPPNTALSVADGALRLSLPLARHGARLPFDFLLHSLADEYGPRAVCVILSGNGADGSLGLRAIKAKHGLVIVQEPSEAEYDGMPLSAIRTDEVDLVLPVVDMPGALLRHLRRLEQDDVSAVTSPLLTSAAPGAFSFRPIIELLRKETAHDFTLYKQGTLQRRIERRMGMAGIESGEVAKYLALLQASRPEVEALANDLLINVTSFFRDARVFEFLSHAVIPELVRKHPNDHPLRVWVAGCSTGEEAYSLAILFREAMVADKRNLKLQVFASDVDPDAVATARDGFYPDAIAAEVSPARRKQFFLKEDGGYRVVPELRACAVFTVQDLLSDPPFSRIDLVSCRNLLIYLGADAQMKVLAAFHFALNESGILLLGTSETVGSATERFEIISKAERVYRHIGRSRPGDLDFLTRPGDGVRIMARGPGPPLTRQAALAERCRRLVMDRYAPAAVLINPRREIIFSSGPTDRYLRIPQGHATLDLLSMVRPALRPKLQAVIDQAVRDGAPATVSGGRIVHEGKPLSFSITAQPLPGTDGEGLLMICFVDELRQEPLPSNNNNSPSERTRISELERELDATRAELRDALRAVETAGEEQKAVNEEALSVNEEYQSANEELLTSKEELQSLNEELTALNAQLQEALDRQRTTSNDLQNILYSTDIATLFLDLNLEIRFFTPSTRAIFSIIASDIGRPLADLRSLATDTTLLNDAREILQTSRSVEREIEAQNGAWYIRRVSPYRTFDNRIEGVVITFTNSTERKLAASALRAAQAESDRANLAKSRFLAAASHDLRQPLQTLVLLQGLLAKRVEGSAAQKLVSLLEPTLSAMSGMLNTLLDINQIDAGTVQPEKSTFVVDDMLRRLHDEFAYLAQAQEVGLRVVRSGLYVHSDPRLLEQMVRNLLSNALKYTTTGRVLLGCRRRGDTIRIEVWDTGIGIPKNQIDAIFNEYHQVGNVARDRDRGLGLGLSIVQRLAELLGHRVCVASKLGRGSMFAIEIEMPKGELALQPPETAAPPVSADRVGTILVIEDDPDLRALLEQLLVEEGHLVTVASDSAAALELVGRGGLRPDLILADFNLPGGIDGLATSTALRSRLSAPVPVIILTGDISTATLRGVAAQGYGQLNKPVKAAELTQMIQEFLRRDVRETQVVSPAIVNQSSCLLYVVDDDRHVREGLRRVLEDAGVAVEAFASCEAFLAAYRPLIGKPAGREACLLVDAWLPGMSGLLLLQTLREAGAQLPAIMITGDSDVPTAVQAMKAGVSDFIEKPIHNDELIDSVSRALERSRDTGKLLAWQTEAAAQIAELTLRQRQVMSMVLAGAPSKNIAVDLGISQRTVENHRAAIMRKTGAKSLPALARLALAATQVSGGAHSLVTDTN